MCRRSCYSSILTRIANLLNTSENGCWVILQGPEKGLLLFMEHQHWATKKAFLIRIYRRILTRRQILKSISNVLDATALSTSIRDIYVWSPYSYVFLLLINLVATYTVQGSVKLLTGKGKFYRTIDVKERCVVIGSEKFKALIGLHHFTGADWGGKLIQQHFQENVDYEVSGINTKRRYCWDIA